MKKACIIYVVVVAVLSVCMKDVLFDAVDLLMDKSEYHNIQKTINWHVSNDNWEEVEALVHRRDELRMRIYGW